MVEFTSVSRTELADRRKRLRRQRSIKSVQLIGRMAMLAVLAGGFAWFFTLPEWVLRRPEQITVEGNELLSEGAVQALLPIEYPKLLLEVQPQQLDTALEENAPISEAVVTRHLLPPGLTVRIQERRPVAIAYSVNPGAAADLPVDELSAHASPAGLLDEKGAWMPFDSYVRLAQYSTLPGLKIFGVQEQYRSFWQEFYELISRSPVRVTEVDWRDPANLILKTDLGIVHFGPYSSNFQNQLVALDRIRELPEKINSNAIEYIDLRNPLKPLVQIDQAKNPDVPKNTQVN